MSDPRRTPTPGVARWLAAVVLACGPLPGVGAQPAASGAAAARLGRAFAQARGWLARPAERSRQSAFAGVMVLEARRYEEPRPLRVWIVRLDLTRGRVRLAVTEPLEAARRTGRWEVPAATTLRFARQRGVQLAVNAAAFWPHRKRAGEPMDVGGLLVVRGEVISPPDPRFAAIHVDAQGQITLAGPPQRTDGCRYVVPGFRMVLIDGRPATWLAPPADGQVTRHPRTGIGLDAAGRTLWIVVADGRQPGVSEGLSQIELAALLSLLGADDGMNLDGGGSSTLVIEHADATHGVVNTPVGLGPPGTLRRVGVNLGFYLPGRGPEGPEPTSLRDALIGGVHAGGPAESGPLRYDGRTFDLSGRNPRAARVLRTLLGQMRTLAAERWGDEPPRRFFAGWDADAFERFVEAFFRVRPVASAPATQPVEPPAATMLATAGLATLHRGAWFAQRGDLIWLPRQDGSWRVAVFWARTIDEAGRVRLWLWPSDAAVAAGAAAEDPWRRWQQLGAGPVEPGRAALERCVIASWR